MKKFTRLTATVAMLAALVSSTLQITTDAKWHEVFSYTCVYADGVVLQKMPQCPQNDGFGAEQLEDG
jgi:hypothetical protein